MSVATYNWNFDKYSEPMFQICISDNLGVLLPHCHDKLELMYFYYTPHCRYNFGNQSIVFHSNELAVVNSNEFHSCDDWGHNCIAVCIIIDLKKIHQVLPHRLRYNNKICSSTEITILFENIKELLCYSNISKAEKNCRITGMIYTLLGILSQHAKPDSAIDERTSELHSILGYIQNNLSENITLTSLAEKMHISPDRFYHIFKEYTGISPIEYVIANRIKKSCELLSNTDMKIAEIAQECNFCTSSYFSKKFNHYMKMSPKIYRKLNNHQ